MYACAIDDMPYMKRFQARINVVEYIVFELYHMIQGTTKGDNMHHIC